MRDSTFDVMKGIGILAMIVGHSPIPKLLESFIFVWHMPLFFLVSGYFFKPKPNGEYIRKNVRQLILPYFLTSSMMILLTGVKHFFAGKGDTLTMVIAGLLGNGTSNNPTFSEYSIGAIWFLLAMFWCRVIFNIICNGIGNRHLLGVIVLIVSIIATYIGSILYVPTDILEGNGALLFFYIGYLARINNLLETTKTTGWGIAVIALLTGLSIYSGSMSMVRCYYGYWPINYLAAIGMTVIIYHLSSRFCGNMFLAWCGRVSMVILCVHIIELTFSPLKSLHEIINYPAYCDLLIHLTLSVSVTWIVLQFHHVRKIFSLG